MSSSIWTQCAGESNLRPLTLEPRRVVEAQHQIATRKLVDTNAEQAVLEDLIERVKPPDPTRGKLHYLLATPFRYPPLPYGSRFGTRAERGIFYGSESLRTAFAETAYYRLLFLEGTRADLGTLETQHTVFSITVRTAQGIDLTQAPFDKRRDVISSKTRYGATQALGRAMRDAGVETFRYRSARDREGGVNIGIFNPRVFGRRRPRHIENWYCAAGRQQVELRKRDYFDRASYAFPREDFLVRGELPLPAP